LPFVVGRAAGVDVAVAEDGFEGRGLPEVERVGGLDVVVAVAEDGGFAGGVEPVRVDERMLGGGNNFDVFEAGGFEAVCDEVGGAVDVGFIFGEGADAGDAEEREELFEEAGFVLFYKSGGGWGHTSIIGVSRRAAEG
jgi:hypothetical protein